MQTAGTDVRTTQTPETKTFTPDEDAPRTLTRAGNIGVMSAQQMATQEIALWAWNFFRDVVFPDLDYLLTLPIY